MKLLLTRLFSLAVAVLFTSQALAQSTHTVTSPDGKIQVEITLNNQITFAVNHESDPIIAPSPISMELANDETLGANSHLRNKKTDEVDQTIESPFYKRSEIRDHYNELRLNFRGNYHLIFRAYNEGVAYRFATDRRDSLTVMNENAAFNFAQDAPVWAPYANVDDHTSYEPQFESSFENTYDKALISQLDDKRLIILPALVDVGNGKKVCITESDLEDYPGMYLNSGGEEKSLDAVFAAYPKREEQGGHNNLQMRVTERKDYIARVPGRRAFPWRVMVISEEDKQLADSDLVYLLASPSRVEDISWIKPGKVAWDWWNAWNLYGVDFEAGINNETYKYYIDFAAEQGIEYVILDEGWSVNSEADLMQVIPEIDLPELVNYGQQKGVDIVLWAGYHAFERDMENVCKHYSNMGVKGFKVDFMDRDDQEAVNFYYRAAELAAKHQLFLDFHGAYKPTGLNRTYPNVLNFEGVHGLEQMKWDTPDVDQVTYDVEIPFIRMVAGSMDYTQGAMRNAIKENYYPAFTEPMSQGTRCRQLAQYVIFESPFNMLCDDPTAYEEESECTDFIATVPTIWDETIVLDGKVGDYVAIARRSGDEWYLGVLTDWDAREITLDLSFLADGKYQAEVFQDGINAHKTAQDYRKVSTEVPKNHQITAKMAPGGGYVARIYQE
ncbi:glycoside hydrolase family 97 protein [Tunicatimonas pelagia]|uniref:glycoside hydrolase family 97 protein n=1 Tax=Tunicatimonas pelagia TaxID=931531 RepID=UPI002664EDDC|nr:glycoside hydrolase family 97 protein [Tunicatimonas pelagia]WKN46178.1 glycoside hydrolase family 97 protein [Tunicatimonas pelagia]